MLWARGHLRDGIGNRTITHPTTITRPQPTKPTTTNPTQPTKPTLVPTDGIPGTPTGKQRPAKVRYSVSYS